MKNVRKKQIDESRTADCGLEVLEKCVATCGRDGRDFRVPVSAQNAFRMHLTSHLVACVDSGM